MHSGGKIISYRRRQAGCASDIAQITNITKMKTTCLPLQRNTFYPFDMGARSNSQGEYIIVRPGSRLHADGCR